MCKHARGLPGFISMLYGKYQKLPSARLDPGSNAQGAICKMSIFCIQLYLAAYFLLLNCHSLANFFSFRGAFAHVGKMPDAGRWAILHAYCTRVVNAKADKDGLQDERTLQVPQWGLVQ